MRTVLKCRKTYNSIVISVAGGLHFRCFGWTRKWGASPRAVGTVSVEAAWRWRKPVIGENPEKADRLLFETQARRSTGIWKHCNDCVYRCRIFNNVEKTAEVFLTGAVYLGGITMQAPNGFVLTKAEKQLIELLRSLEFGELRIMVKDSKPIRVEEIRRSIQLQSDK